MIRESGGDRSAVTGGTVVLSDWIKVRVTAAPGSSFLDRMIALVEGASRQKTPNELALSILLSGMTLIFLIVVVTLWGLAGYSGTVLSVTVLVALLVTLIPTTIGGLLSAIGIAGMDRLIRFNVVATSGRAVEAAGDVDTLLLDKTGTITYGNRLATAFIAVPASPRRRWLKRRSSSSLADETPEGRSIVALAKGEFRLTEPTLDGKPVDIHRVLGADPLVRDRHRHASIRKGAVDAVLKHVGMTMDGGACRFPRCRRCHRAIRRHTARRRRGQDAHRRYPSQGRREARHQGALRRVARHGHQDRDGDGRQSGDGGRHRD